MRHPSADVIGIAILAEVDIVPRSGFGMLQASLQQIDGIILFGHEHMSQLMADHQRPQGSDRIREKRMGKMLKLQYLIKMKEKIII